MRGIVQDLRYAIRGYAKNPGVAITAVAILALGIGANTAIMSLLDSFYVRTLPVRNASRLVEIYQLRHRPGYFSLSYPDYLFFRDRARSFTALAAHYSYSPLNLATKDQSSEINGSVVTRNYFDLLGVQPSLGRFFLPEEDRVPGRDPVAVMGYGLWQNRFGGDPAILGRIIRLNGTDFTVVGVAPPTFHGVPLGGLATDVWIPSAMFRVGYRYCDAFQRGCEVVKLIGRLKPGVSRAQAQADMDLLARQLEASYPETNRGRGIAVLAARGVDPEYRQDVGRPAPLLAGLAGLLLAIACANLAGLLLARGSARRREIAIRLALGATRGRIIRQLLVESVLLAIVGGALGLLLALWANDLIATFYAADIEGRRIFFHVGVDALVLALAFATSLLTGIVFGLAPALEAARTDIAHAARDGDSRDGVRRFRLLDVLVVAQIAFSVILVTGAGLLLGSLRNIYRGPGFDPRPIVLLRLRPSLVAYEPSRAESYQREVVRRVESIPGVRAAAPAEMPPLPGWGRNAPVWLPGRAPDREEDALAPVTNRVGPRYFATLGARLLQGREFDESDRRDAMRVAIVNETLAHQLWGGQVVTGQSLLVAGVPHRIVGVVADLQYRNAGQPPVPFLYTDFWQTETIETSPVDSRLHVRVDGDPRAMLATIRRQIVAVDGNVPISEDRPLTDWLGYTFQPVRLAGAVLSSFGSLGLLLSAIGLYGVLAFSVNRRRREIAIRMALGADAARVTRSVLRQGVLLALVGSIVGAAGALASSRWAAALLYGLKPTDPVTLGATISLLFAVAVLACYLPARRAARVDPLTALRME